MGRCRSRGNLPTLDERFEAPEIAILHTLRTTIELALVALTAAQPELWPTPEAPDGHCPPRPTPLMR